MDTERWIPVADAVTVLGKSERTLRRWIAAGRLPAMSDNTGRVLVNMAAVTGTRQAAPDTTPEQAAVAALTGRCVALEKENAALREDRDYLRSALAAALSLQQKALPAPGKRAWWAFWRRDEG